MKAFLLCFYEWKNVSETVRYALVYAEDFEQAFDKLKKKFKLTDDKPGITNYTIE